MDELNEMYNPAHPGEVLRDLYLEPLGLSVTQTAKALNVSRKHLSQVLNGHARVSTDLALRLAKAFATSTAIWLDMQRNHDLWQASRQTDLTSVTVLRTDSAIT